MNESCFITIAMVILIICFDPYGIIYMTVFTSLDFPIILDGQFIRFFIFCVCRLLSMFELGIGIRWKNKPLAIKFLS